MNKFLSLLYMVILSSMLNGCILSASPQGGECVTIELDEAQTFSITDAAKTHVSIVWSLDGEVVQSGGPEARHFDFTPETEDLGEHTLTVTATSTTLTLFTDSHTWCVEVVNKATCTEEGDTRSTECGTGACASTGEETCINGEWINDTCAPHAASDEVCGDDEDNDCDGDVDEECIMSTWYEDSDDDKYGNPDVSVQAETQPEGYVADNTDCDDNDADVNPGAPEICDGIDNNCDGNVDEGLMCSGKIVFLTDGAWKGGELGGLTGADDKCQAEAEAAGLSGSFMAWLSDDSTGTPATRFDKTGGPYILVSDIVVAEDWEDLTDGSLQNPIDLNAKGEAGCCSQVWTDTRANGTLYSSNYHCQGWNVSDSGSGKYGTSTEVDQDWTLEGPDSCNNSKGLYCFQQ